MSERKEKAPRGGQMEVANRKGEDANCISNYIYKKTLMQPVRGISAFERLRDEWIALHPIHSEAELLAVCITFAARCGLILHQKVLEQQLGEASNGETKANTER